MPLVPYKPQSSSQSSQVSEHAPPDNAFTWQKADSNANQSDFQSVLSPHDEHEHRWGSSQAMARDDLTLLPRKMKERKTPQLYTRTTNPAQSSDTKMRLELKEAEKALARLKADLAAGDREAKESKGKKSTMTSGGKVEEGAEDSAEDEEYSSPEELWERQDFQARREQAQRYATKTRGQATKSKTMPTPYSQQYYPNGGPFPLPRTGPHGAGPSYHPQHPFPLVPPPFFGSPIFAPHPSYGGAPPHGPPAVVSNHNSGNVHYNHVSDIGNDYSKNYTATRRPKKTRGRTVDAVNERVVGQVDAALANLRL